MSIINMSVLTGAQFPLTGAVSKAITGGSDRAMSDGEKVAAGFMGGALSGVICAPMELVMIQQQRFGTSLVSAAGRIISEYGAPTLFRGLSTSCGREGLFTAGYLGIGPVFGEKLQQNFGVSKAVSGFAGAVGAGMIAATLSHPLDTIKTCMQGDVEQKTYKSISQTVTTLYSSEGGTSRFFRGWAWRTGRMILAIFLLGQVKVHMAPRMFPKHYTKEEQ